MTRGRFIIGSSVLLVVLYLSPLMILRENSHIRIHDNLDGAVATLAFMGRNGVAAIWNPGTVVEGWMNGLPRSCYPSNLSVMTLLWAAFKPFTAYLINEILVHVVAFLGVFLFLRRLLRKQMKDWVDGALVAGVSIGWAFVPFYSVYGLSIAGQPLLFFAFLGVLRREAKVWDYAVLVLFPFYSSLVLAGVFIIVVLMLVFALDWLRGRKANLQFLASLALLATMYLAVEYQLVSATLSRAGFVSHRVEWVQTSLSLRGVALISLNNLVKGQEHAVSLHKYILLLVVPLTLVGGYKRRLDLRWLLVLLGVSLAISVFRGLWAWSGLVPLMEHVTLFRTMQFDRFYWLQPTLWYIIFAFCLLVLRGFTLGDYGKGTYLAVLLLALQLLFVVRGNSDRLADLRSAGKTILRRPDKSMTYGRFFSEDLFKDIAGFIGRPQSSYRVVSLGIHPSVAQYNGFSILDGYCSSYPLEYKHAFRRIIERELDNSPKWKAYFDAWGSRCYVFSSELEGFMYTKSDTVRVVNLRLNTAVLREMGGEYVLSAVEILNCRDNDLELLRIFENDHSPWRIYLYRVREEPVPETGVGHIRGIRVEWASWPTPSGSPPRGSSRNRTC